MLLKFAVVDWKVRKALLMEASAGEMVHVKLALVPSMSQVELRTVGMMVSVCVPSVSPVAFTVRLSGAVAFMPPV